MLRESAHGKEAPDRFDTELIRLLLKSSETANFAPEERIKYINDMTTKRDIENQILYAKEEGHDEGLAAGIQKGREEGLAAGVQKGREEGLAAGIQKGLADGLERGIQQEKMESARKMKELGADVNFICQVSGLTPEQVAAL